MADPMLRQSPLAPLGLEARAAEPPVTFGVALGERPFAGQVNLRGEVRSRAFTGAVRRVLGIAPPAKPNTLAEAGETALLWLGPDEWLAVLPGARLEPALAELRAALAGQHHAITDVSHARAVIAVQGPAAREVLAKGMSLDLHPRAFGPGRCAQTTLARCQVILRQRGDDPPSFDLLVARSFAAYAWEWLEDAGREHGVRVLGMGELGG